MFRWIRSLGFVLVPALLMGVVLLGCSGDKPGKPKKSRSKDGDDEGGDETAAPMKPVTVTGKRATIKGVVKFEGDEPDTAALTAKLQTAMKTVEKDINTCLTSAPEKQKEQQAWRIDPDSKGVENVFVWIRPVKDDEFFDVSEIVKKQEGYPLEVTIDQPHCAFVPHARILFPRYNDPKRPTEDFSDDSPKTGQVFKVLNSSPLSHNTKWTGGNELIPSMNHRVVTNIFPNYKAPVVLSCSIHPWMNAYVWAFDHPYAAITNAKGEYEIKNVPVPAGMKVRIVAWHEAAEWLADGGARGQEISLKEGNNDGPKFTARKK